MAKGLGLPGQSGDGSSSSGDYVRVIREPKVLILGNGVSAYLPALVLTQVYGIPKERLAITGRSFLRLEQFRNLAGTRKDIAVFNSPEALSQDLRLAGNQFSDGFDIAFECDGASPLRSDRSRFGEDTCEGQPLRFSSNTHQPAETLVGPID
jgi:hypothetical protein